MPAKKPIIAVDIDDVLVDHYEALVTFHNETYGTSLTIHDYISDHWHEVWGTTPEETELRAQAFAALGVKDRVIKQGVAEALVQLSRKYDLVIVTARRKVNVDQTLEWIDERFPHVFKEVRFVPIWDEDSTLTKAEICREVGATYLIDDSLKHCRLAAEAGITAILFGDYGWNQASELPEGVTRCKDWVAVLEYFDGRKG
jgi:uncharacterized HAD superfamily protein